MKLCSCNKCGNLYEDTNPQNNALEYPDVEFPSLVLLNIDSEELESNTLPYWGCPVDKTDAYLSDDSLALFAKNEPNKTIIKAAIAEYEILEEYQEEDTTGWSQLENLRNLLD